MITNQMNVRLLVEPNESEVTGDEKSYECEMWLEPQWMWGNWWWETKWKWDNWG